MSETPVTVPFVSFRPMERELDADLRGAFARVLDNSWYIGGREDATFEKAFADYCGVRHCVGCGNGLDALVLILKAMGIGPGDEVIAPSNTFIATVLAISYAMNDMMERKVGRWQWAVYGMTAFSVVLFAAFYPVLIGLMVPSWYPTRFLRWIPGGAWPF